MANNTRIEVFEEACETVSRTIGRNQVTVVFAGDQAKTNGQTIVLPSLPRETELTPEQVSITRGYVDHEAAHIRFTDMPTYQAASKEAQRSENYLLGAMLNTLEDARIEQRVLADYPGSRDNLSATNNQVIKEFLEAHKSGGVSADNIREVGPIAAVWQARKLLGLEDAMIDEALDKMSSEVRETSLDWAKRALKCGSTSDIVALAKELVGELEAKEEEPPPKKPPGGGEGDGDGPGDGGDGTEEREGHMEGAAPPATRDQLEDEDDLEEEAEAPDLEPKPERKPFVPELDMSKVLGKPSTKGYRVFTTSYDRFRFRKGTSKLRGGQRNYTDIIRRAGSAIGVMATKLERALLERQRSEWHGGQEAGRIDGRRLVSAAAGSPRVFKLKEHTEVISAAVQIVVDLSGSMSGSKVAVAEQCCIALARALEITGVQFEIVGFYNSMGCGVTIGGKTISKLIDETGGGLSKVDDEYTRYEPLVMPVFKDFEDSMRDAAESLGTISRNVGSNNSDGEALLMAYRRLRQRHETNKIMIVMSDGSPACAGNGDHLNEHLRQVVKYLEDEGVKTVGIGILDGSVSRFYPRWVVVNSLDEFTKTSIDVLSKAILGETTSGADLIEASRSAGRSAARVGGSW